MKTFLNTIYGKAIAVLTIVALALGIIAEGVNIYKTSNEAKIAEQKAAIELQTARNAELLKKAEAVKLEAEAGAAEQIARNAERLRVAEAEERAQLAKKAAAEAETAREAANNAGKLKLAEADERSWLAKKAAADAEAARAAADNAGKLKLAEAEKETQLAKKAAADAEAAKELAKKAAFDAETAKATADNAANLKFAEARKAEEEAENLRQKNKILRGFTEGGGSVDDMVMRDFNRQMDKLGLGNNYAPRQQANATPANQPQASQPPYLRVKSDESDGKLNLRNGPGLSHNVIAELPAGTLLRQVGVCIPSDDSVTHDPWCKVDWNGTTGWASSSGLERYARP